jgi:hypothetical protein
MVSDKIDQLIGLRMMDSRPEMAQKWHGCSPRNLTSSRESFTLFIWTGGHVSFRVVNVTWIDLDFLAFILHFLNQF